MTSPTQRIAQVATHLDPRTWTGKGLPAAAAKNDSDVVIVATGRTPYCKAYKGGLKDTSFEKLCLETFKGIIAKADIDPALIQDVVLGNVRNADGAYAGRAAQLAAGIPHTASFMVVNRWCSSGLMAIRTIANQIQTGEIECGLALGVESMSAHPKREMIWDDEIALSHPDAADCKMPMGWTSENVAGEFAITRQQMDEFASLSHSRASQAQAAGHFDSEIFPISVPHKDPQTKETTYKIISQDDGIRHGTTPESLAKIKPAFPQWAPSHTTGGNASQITDGGAAVLLMRRSLANRLGKKPIAKYVACVTSGLPPRIMGIGPSLAIPRLLDLTGISSDQIDHFEINEAFASMSVYCRDKLSIPQSKLNPQGGAIALGHPLGSTGARLTVTALEQIKRKKEKVAVVSMCIGLGMGAAGLFINEDE